MKLRYLLVLLLFLPALVSAETIDRSDLVKRDGLSYKDFTNVPFTGRTRGQFQGTYKDGTQHGPYESYHENGQLWMKTTYKDGKKHGPTEWYYKNGQLWKKGTYNDGELVNQTCFTETGETKPCK